MPISYKNQIKEFFLKTKAVSCPAFNNKPVIFNAKGMNHLLYKGSRSRRDEPRIKINAHLLPMAFKVLEHMYYWQEESLYSKDGILYKFWCFEAVVDNRRIKVVVRQRGNGHKHFWSVIPAWRKDRFGILNAKKRNLEE